MTSVFIRGQDGAPSSSQHSTKPYKTLNNPACSATN